jgi:arylsulfatase A-like enzyme
MERGAIQAVLLAALVTIGCRPASAGEGAGRGVLLVAVDGLRADHVSGMGYDRETTPHLDRLAAEGVVFERAFSTAPLLQPSHVALVTGCDPNVSRRFSVSDQPESPERSWHIPREVPHLAVEFLAAGFRTAAFVDHRFLASPALGFDVGFQKFDGSESDAHTKARSAGLEALSSRVLAWVRGLDRDADWFAYVHLHDLERSWRFPDTSSEPYFQARRELSDVPPIGNTDSTFFAVPRSRWIGGSRTIGKYEALYDHHVRLLDAELDRLLGSLAVLGRLEDTTVVFVGTHGIQFGEAGLVLSSGMYTTADLHVPLVLRPGRGLGLPSGHRVEHLTSLADVAPTLLELHGIEVPAGTHGRSHVPWLVDPGRDEPGPWRWIFASCGIQAGGVAIGERFSMERTRPTEMQDAEYRATWFGLDDVPPPATATEGWRTVFYDRTVTPYPPLFDDPARAVEAPPDGNRMLSESMEWYVNVHAARRILQSTGRLEPEVDEDLRRRLVELGFLGETR